MKYQYTFHIVHAEAEAQAFCAEINKRQSKYMTKHHPAHYTPWSSSDGRETGFVCWYYM